MPDGTSVLKTGEALTIKVVDPPLGRYANRVGCWRDVRDELLGGGMSETLLAPYFIGEIDGEVVGSMGCYTPRDTRDVGLVEFVETDERHRQKGIASALLGSLIDHFRSGGGGALLLCTTNPIAGSLYEKHGFRHTVGDGMTYVSPDRPGFTNDYLSYGGEARVRNAEWGDLPRAALLYNNPEPSWLVKNYLTSSFVDTRFERHFAQLTRGSEDGRGGVLALVNPRKRLVGLAAFHRLDTYYEQHVATLAFRVCPAYMAQAGDLLQSSLERAAALSIGIVQTHIADVDDDQKEIVQAAGFSETARLPGHFWDGIDKVDMLIYTCEIESCPRITRGRGDYYAGRQPWQSRRLSQGGLA